MRLHSLRLQNFRQHADTTIEFERGLTGVIGPNGAGKSTLLEAIAWALYGNAAARGTRDGIRNSRADGKAPVRVELDFALAGHRYRVVRGLTTAECFLDGGDAPIASTIKGVTELLQKRLGMTRVEFFHTYFTGQKELDVMATLGPADRARFLSRVLGYDRLSNAQEIVRERRRALVAETNGLKQGMPDAEEVQRRLTEVEAHLQAATARAETAEVAQRDAVADLQRVSPQWTAAQAERDRVQQIMAELAVADSDATALARDVERLDREVDAIRVAQDERTPLLVEVAPLADLRAQLTVLDALAVADSRRQALVERVRGVREEAARLGERRTKLESAPTLEGETQQQLAVARAALTAAEQALEKERTAWVRDKQEAETRLESLRVQYTEFAQQRDTLEGLGEESPCPTCGRPLGASYRGVLDLVSEQLETVRVDGNYYRQRVEQLTKTPDAVSTLDERRRAASQEVASNERRLTKIQAALTELAGLDEQRRALDARLLDATSALESLPTGYDAAQHTAVRAAVTRLADLETRVARLSGLLEREEATRAERERVGLALAAARDRVTALESQRASGRHSDAEFATARDAYDRAALAARRAELEAVSATAEVTRARGEHAAAERRRGELVRLQGTLERLDADKRLHDELDRALTDLRTDLNFQLRPELSDIASRFLADLTDGRYNALEFDEDYALLVLEDGLPKPVISGGEEDLCNLVLRLAISQMIAERADRRFPC